MIRIKEYNAQGSTVTEYSAVKEAEEVLEEARRKGGFVFTQSTSETLNPGEPLKDGETYEVIKAIAGG